MPSPTARGGNEPEAAGEHNVGHVGSNSVLENDRLKARPGSSIVLELVLGSKPLN